MEQTQLNLGCGSKQLEGFVNIDKRASVDPDLCCDIATGGLPYEDNTVDMVMAYDFLEHIHPDKVIFVIEEIHRVLKPGGIFQHHTPSTDGRGAWQDPTHRSFWNFNSWNYFTEDIWREEIGTSAKFEIIELGDILTSTVHQIIHTYGKFRKVVVS